MTTIIKKKRIKKVFSGSDQVIHLWANQTQTYARCKNVFFEGESIYSYGRHYELGRMVDYKGIKVAMINDRGYSSTTNGHISSAYVGVSHLPRLKSHQLGAEHIPSAMIRLQGELIDSLMKVFSERSFYAPNRGTKDDYNVEDINEFNTLCKTLGFSKLVLEVPKEFFALQNEHIKAMIQRAKELTSPEALAAKEAKKLKAAEEALEKWTNSGVLHNSLRNLNTQFIRVNGNKVQTTRGAEVSLVVAVKILQRLKIGKAKQGDNVGPFTIREIAGDTIRIGCHTLSLKQCQDTLANSVNLSLVE